MSSPKRGKIKSIEDVIKFEDVHNFGSAFKYYRSQSGISVRLLAQRSEVNYETLKNWGSEEVDSPLQVKEILKVAVFMPFMDYAATKHILSFTKHSPLNKLYDLNNEDKEKEFIDLTCDDEEKRFFDTIKKKSGIAPTTPTTTPPPAMSKSSRLVVQISQEQITGNDDSKLTGKGDTPKKKLPENTIPQIAPLPKGSRMDLPSNNHFVGREYELTELAKIFNSEAVIGQIVAATGIGGIGKTQLAVEFAHRYGQFFEGGVYWLSFADRQGVPDEIANCGVTMEGMREDYPHLALKVQVRLVQEKWQNSTPRLLIFDNCEDVELLMKWRPSSGGCRVLITSRKPYWNPVLGVSIVTLETFTRSQSIELLRKFRPDLAAEDTILDKISAELGDLPLALHMAGSFLNQRNKSMEPEQYLTQLHQVSPLAHLSMQSGYTSPTQHILSVSKTFAISYDQLRTSDPIDVLAQKLLAHATCFAPGETIPRNLLVSTYKELSGVRHLTIMIWQLFKMIWQLFKLRKQYFLDEIPDSILQRLIDLGLIEEATEGGLRIHRLVAYFVRQTDNPWVYKAQQYVESAIFGESKIFDESALFNPSWQVHLRYWAGNAMSRSDDLAGYVCSRFGLYLDLIGDYHDAYSYHERALAIHKNTRRKQDRIIAFHCWNLGRIHMMHRSNFVTAKHYFDESIAIIESTYRNYPVDATKCWYDLKLLVMMKDNLEVAERYFNGEKPFRVVLFYKHGNDVVFLCQVLSILFQRKGDFDAAKHYLERSLVNHKMVYGKNAPSTALFYVATGDILLDHGDFTKAKQYFKQAMDVLTESVEVEESLTIYKRLGLLYEKMGELDSAIFCIEQVLRLCNDLEELRYKRPPSELIFTYLEDLRFNSGCDPIANYNYLQNLYRKKSRLG